MSQTLAPGSQLSGSPADSFGFRRILYSKKDYIATITINRPDVLNCFDMLTLNELGTAYLDAGRDDDIAVVVITGAGDKAFCTGADLKEQEEHILKKPNDYYKWMYAFIEMHDRLRNIGKPTIARLNGMVVGGGNELNMACDLAVAADHVTIKQVGAARGSVAAGGATQWLPLIVGDRRAREILLLCENIDAYTALDWGLVNQVVPGSMLDSAVQEMAEKLHNKLPECTRYTKQQMNFWRDFSWTMTIGHARDWLTLHAGHHETAEGLRAFRKKTELDYAQLHALKKEPQKACAQCKTEMPETFKFCGTCGKPLS
ncbi:MAG: enoyl-CoA hydratase-related protein [Cyanobacteriota/Melainabacteria group bacterium]|nr:enoyl-CoA hydratase/isomerase family protein [Cyanobacteria bacterium HKST-UBA01]MCB9468579.1 enoyl-CoA hydratase/isomerase family protein [Candidatus Obscuribacterales bacterium]